jgi:hypothetical protein
MCRVIFLVQFVTVLIPAQNVFTLKTLLKTCGLAATDRSYESRRSTWFRSSGNDFQFVFGSSNAFLALILLVRCEFHNEVVLGGVGLEENHRLCDEYTKFHHLQMFVWLLPSRECNSFSIWPIWRCLCLLACILGLICSVSSTQTDCCRPPMLVCS